MRNVYVAGKTDDYMNVREAQGICASVGLHVTFDWTEVVEKSGPLLDPSERQRRRQAAYNDLEGVREADLLVMLCYPGLCGTLIEFGVAAEREMPIIVVGTPERESVFFELDDIYRCPVLEMLPDTLEEHFGLMIPQDA